MPNPQPITVYLDKVATRIAQNKHYKNTKLIAQLIENGQLAEVGQIYLLYTSVYSAAPHQMNLASKEIFSIFIQTIALNLVKARNLKDGDPKHLLQNLPVALRRSLKSIFFNTENVGFYSINHSKLLPSVKRLNNALSDLEVEEDVAHFVHLQTPMRAKL
jgi:hypothetical protein